MPRLEWDKSGEHLYETGVDRGVLYLPVGGVYSNGYSWNGLTAVTESPSGAEPTPMYADNIKYLNLLSREDFMATIEAMTYPNEFMQCDGTATPAPGVFVAQQTRRKFGLSYRTRIGNEDVATDLGYKLHLIYGALAAPTEKAYATVNDTPEAITFSWELSTTEVDAGPGLKPTALVTVDSTKVSPANLQALEDALYGTAGSNPRLPLPAEVAAMFTGTLTTVTPTAPTYNTTTRVVTIPNQTGVIWRRSDTNAVVPNGSTVTIPAGTSIVFTATPAAGFRFTPGSDDDFSFGA